MKSTDSSLVVYHLSRLRKETIREYYGNWVFRFFRYRSTSSDIHAKSLLVGDGQVFIANVYMKLLNRPVDTNGLNHYLNALNTGKFNKLDIISSIMDSTEGKNKNIAVSGLSWRLALNNIIRIRNQS